jgi:hypothetical protein
MKKTALDPVEVIVRFDIDGEVHPIKFVHHGTPITVASTGRCWEDETGLHILVMDHQALVYELIFVNGDRWYIKRAGQPGKIILTT